MPRERLEWHLCSTPAKRRHATVHRGQDRLNPNKGMLSGFTKEKVCEDLARDLAREPTGLWAPSPARLIVIGASRFVPCASLERSLILPSPGGPLLKSRVPPTDLRPPRGPCPLALRAVDGVRISLSFSFWIASLALGLAIEFFGLLRTPLGFQGAPLGILGSALGLPGALFG